VPAFIAGAAAPLIVFFLAPPSLKKTPDAPQAAAAKLKSLGSVKFAEGFTLGTLIGAIILWVRLRPSALPCSLASFLRLYTSPMDEVLSPLA
jgi:di/tricarboxylate transporter